MDRTIRSMAMLAVGAFALGLPCLAHAADANPPERMTYQGYLVDSDGDPLGADAPANYDVVFRIYNVNQGGLTIWGEQQTITVDNGYFSVLLGEGVLSEAAEGIETLSDVFQGDDISDRFIGITVSGISSEADIEIAPRLRLVTSPFAFTASQARRLTDGVGNNNFFKEGSSLKLGAGTNPTLTLPESGGATLEGTLTATLPGSGAGLQINNGSNSTTLGANSSDYFELSTSLDKFLVNDDLYVKSKIYSLGTDLTLGPSNNSDTYLKIHSHSDDYIHAYADRFAVVGDDYWTEMRFSPGQADLVTSAGKFKMNKSLEVDGNLNIDERLGIGTTTPYFKLQINYDGNAVPWHDSNGWHDGINFGLIVKNNLVDYASPNKGQMHNLILFADKNSTQAAIGGYREAYYAHFLGGLSFHTASQPSGYIGNTPTSPQQARLSLTEKMRITPAGNVGIGTTSPYANLHVFDPAHAGNGYEADVRVETTLQRLILKSHYHYNVIQYSSIQSTANSAQGWTLALNPDGGNVGIGTTSPSQRLHVQGNIFASGTITPSSDRRAKTDLEPVDPKEVLERVVDLPIERWRFKTEDEGVKHVGPMAQDFHEAFGLGESDTAIATVDADGVAFAAIQGLNLKLNEKEAEIDSLETRNRGLEAEMETLQDEVALLKASLVHQNAQEDRITKLEELVEKLGQGL